MLILHTNKPWFYFTGYVSKEAASRKSVVHEAVRRASFAVNMPTSERMTEDANMHHVLRQVFSKKYIKCMAKVTYRLHRGQLRINSMFTPDLNFAK